MSTLKSGLWFVVCCVLLLVALPFEFLLRVTGYQCPEHWTAKQEGQAFVGAALFLFFFFLLVAAMLWFVFRINVVEMAGI